MESLAKVRPTVENHRQRFCMRQLIYRQPVESLRIKTQAARRESSSKARACEHCVSAFDCDLFQCEVGFQEHCALQL
ncbi:hypothetical protein ASF43_03085 [Pseudorhodoferax sp. Leaf267]|nr:hypothetical protein ASF43_03085 [Pseudorhodoferax sp. Leaf267]